MKTFLFFTRLALYGLLVTVPYLPGEAVPVPYDWIGRYTWFFLVPAMMFAAYFLRAPRFPWWWGPASAAALLLLSVLWVSEFRWYAIALLLTAGSLSFIWTRMIFGSGRGLGLAALEMFFFGLVYFKMLSFTRSSEDVARATLPVAKALLILAVISFLVHGLILYLAAFPDRSRQRRRRELLMFTGITLPIVLVVALFVPMTYVQNDIPLNDFNEPPPPKPEIIGEGDGEAGSEGDLADAQGAQGGGESGNGLPLGEGDQPYPSERQGGGRELDDPSERETRPDENRGGGGQGGEDSELPRGGNGGGGGGQGQQQGEGQGGQGQPQQGEGGGQGQNQQRLEGVPSDQWNNFLENSGEGQGKQAAIMVVASPVDPVYAAYEYLGDFHDIRGFELTSEDREPLNELAHLHLAETWQDQITSRDDKRATHEVFYLSSLKERAVAYRPFRIQPTIEDRTYHPFDLSYHAVSRFSMSTPEDWYLVRDLSEAEEQRYADYLEVDMDEKTKQDFERHLKRSYSLFKKDMIELEQKERTESTGADDEASVPNWRGERDGLRYFARIEALLRGFREHQYEVGFDEDTRVAKLHSFLSETKSGDCTEFAHSAAILARMAGVPSRVVVGFLASRDLQTPAHQRGVYELQKKIKPLQRYRREELYLVTTSHHHAWVQFWVPGFGWIDYETTAFAIPPKPQFNPNNQDVIIPMIEEEKNVLPQRAFQFPWYLALRVTIVALVLIVLILYGFRFVREWYFYLASRGKSRKALRALFQYLLMRLAREGYDVKRPYETSLEYAERHPGLRAFAQTYTELLFREQYGPGEQEAVRARLLEQYRTAVVEMRKPGLWSLLRRGFSLRSLYY